MPANYLLYRTSPSQRIIPSVASVFISRENEVRWRIDLLSDIGNDKYPFPSNIGRVMSVSIKIHVLNIHIVRDILKLNLYR